MLIWVHCNKCYTRFTSQIQFYITNCYHVYCNTCLEKLKQRNSCLLCNSNKPGVLQLNNDIPETVKALFTSFEDHVDKTQSIVKFQMRNCSSLLQQTVTKYSKLKVEYAKVNHMLSVQKNENRRLKQALIERTNQVNRNSYEASTPALGDTNMSTSSSPCFINMTFSTIHNPNASCVPHTGRECAPQPVTRVAQQNYRFVTHPAQKMHHPGKAVLSRPSPVQMVPTHTFNSIGSRGSSATSSMRNLSLGSAQRQPHIFKTNHPKF